MPRPPISTLFPYTTLFRSPHLARLRIGLGDAHIAAMIDDEPRIRALGDQFFAVRQFARAHAQVETHPQLSQKLEDRKSTRLNSSHVEISYAVFCLKKKKKN